jgi:hypothetical protein
VTTLASTYLAAAKNALSETRDRLESSADLPELTMSERTIMLKVLALISHDVADIRKQLA